MSVETLKSRQASRVRRCAAPLCLLAAALAAAPPPAAAEAASTEASERGLAARWQLAPRHLRGRTFRPLAGSLGATVVGPIRFSTKGPAALILDGNSKAKHRVDITADLAAASLPAEAITVEAWALLEAAPKWGAFLGALQDNGDYERGWLLGNKGDCFCFAVATKAAGRLTYLTARRAFETGYWYHVVGTYDGREQKLYVDGGLAARASLQRGPIAYPPKAFYTLGAYRDDNELYTMKGRIERVSVYSRCLSAKEVAALFQSRKKLFPDIEPQIERGPPDWPTYFHDSRRTGCTDQQLTLPLRLRWVHRPRHAPRPAWPPPARHDYWHRKRNLRPRVVYDRAFHLVGAGDGVYFGSSADDKVTCLDARTGRAVWSFFTAGPVRLAPTVADGKVLVGSDDGWVYCLDATGGSLLWKHKASPLDRRIPGNGRMISLWPVRTGVLVEDGTAFFCAGLFPLQGVYQAAVELRTGRVAASGPVEASTQGYLVRTGSRLLAPTGRDPKGALLAKLRRRGKAVHLGEAPGEHPYAFIGAGETAIAGGDGKVAALRLDDGRQLWSAAVEGRAYALALSRGRLLVGTDAGGIYCFAHEAVGEPLVTRPPPVRAPVAEAGLAARCADLAGRVVRASKIRRGYCLLLGSAGGRLAWELARRTEMRIVVVEPDERKVAAARRALDAAGVYGVRAAVHHGRLDKLPYADGLFNVVVSAAIVQGGPFAGRRAEVLRVLRPGRGVAVLGSEASNVVRREAPAAGGEWTHLFADAGNTACSGDRIVGGKMSVQWFGRPGPREMVDRHHRNVPPLVKDGRLFVPGDQVILAMDPYNGTILWRAGLPGSRRLGVFLDCGSMAVDDRHLYVAVKDECIGLDVGTGRRAVVRSMPQLVEGRKRHWGYVAYSGDVLVGSGRKQGAGYRRISREADAALWYDNMSLVTSDYLFALGRRDGRQRWTYRSGAIVNTTIAIGDGRVYFIESHAPKAVGSALGRVPMRTFLDGPNHLVALDLDTGRVAWKRKFDLSDCRLIVYLSAARGRLVLSGCRYVDKRLWYFFYGIDAASGSVRWRQSHDTGFKPGGGHGEQNRHPTIVGDVVYTYPYAYRLRDGERVEGWKFSRHGHGCGNVSASARCLFWRGGNPWMWPLDGGGPTRLNAVTRPGCFINIIPAGGLVLIPEASSGCTCDYPLQTSLGLAPVK